MSPFCFSAPSVVSELGDVCYCECSTSSLRLVRCGCRYRGPNLKEEELLNCMYSISDNNSFLLFNRDPIDRMINYMKQYFQPNQAERGFDLGISMGSGGARLSHNHERQYTYVMQSLMLW